MDPRSQQQQNDGSLNNGRASTSPQTGFNIPMSTPSGTNDFWFNGSNAGSSLGDRSLGGDDTAMLSGGLGSNSGVGVGSGRHRSNSNLDAGGKGGNGGGSRMEGIEEDMESASTSNRSQSFNQNDMMGQHTQGQLHQHQHQQMSVMQLDQATINDAVHALDGSMTEDIWKFPFG